MGKGKEKVDEVQEDVSEEAAKRESKEVQTNELKAEKAAQKAAKKTKMVQCKVMLLDGTEYSCDLEVSAALLAAVWRPVSVGAPATSRGGGTLCTVFSSYKPVVSLL